MPRFTRRHAVAARRGSRGVTQSLRALERDGLVGRTVYAVVPPKVENRLTDLGQSLLEPSAAVKAWAESNYGAVLDARARQLT